MADKFPSLEDYGIEDPLKPKPKGKVEKLPDLSSLSSTPEEGLSGIRQNYAYDDYNFQPKLNADNDKLRAQAQTGWQQAGRFFGNLLPNIGASMLENVGYLGSLASEWGDDRDYSNWLTDLGHSIRNPFGDIYRENPNNTWDVSDPAWWYNNSEGLVESATGFAIEGAGIAKLFSGAAKLLRFGSTAKNLVRGTEALAHLSTSAALAYTEAAQFGATTFQTTYQNQYKKLRDETLI